MAFSSLRLSRLPLVAAPMAGGPSTVALARAVAQAGAFPFLAAGYKTPAAMVAEIEALRGTGVAEFGVNLFVPSTDAVDRTAFAAYAASLAEDAERYGIRLSAEPATDDDCWAEKVALLVTEPVPVVSFTFGLPPRADVVALQGVGTCVLASVTSPAEARDAQDLGVDGLVVQGSGAGGHSAAHNPSRTLASHAAAELVREVRAAVDRPLIAAGGVDGPESVGALLDAGADSVAVGTLLLLAAEAGTNPIYRAALQDPRFTETVLTRAFTGRLARALRNGFAERHPEAPNAYPAIHHLTRPFKGRCHAGWGC